jgi:DNA primase
MSIPDEDVARVRAATDIVALIGEHAALRQQGRQWVGLCPFHQERSPSFSVNAELGVYYCFGCQASGDAISFVRAVEHLDFADAVGLLAERSGIAIRQDAEDPGRRHRKLLLDTMERAVVWYHDRLLRAPDAGHARDYLRSRGYDGETVRRFRLGWAPDEWDALSTGLDLSTDVLSGTGLGFVNRRSRRQDAFRARVLFPICDPSGRPVALGGRILPGAGSGGATGGEGVARSEPKYKNSPETSIYAKRRTLYALNWAKQDIVASGEVVVCEGYTDVIGFFLAGVPRAVATCGTALGEEHFAILRNFARRVVLAFDADSAGQAAISRVYEWERRHEVDVVVAALPAGSDPGELSLTDPSALGRAVADARPFLQFRIDRALEAADLSSAEGRARAAEQALNLVAEHPDVLVRDHYIMVVSDRCRIDPARGREQVDRARSRRDGGEGSGHDGRRSRATEQRPPTAGSGERGRSSSLATRSDPAGRAGLEALRLAVHRPETVADVLEDVLFVDPLQRRAFHALAGTANLHDAIAGADPEAADLLRRIAVEAPFLDDDDLGDPVDAVVTQLVRVAGRRSLGELQAQARSGTGDLRTVADETVRVRLLLEALDDPRVGREATDRLVAWLLERGEET